MSRVLNLDKMREKYLALAEKAEEGDRHTDAESFMVAALWCLNQKDKIQDQNR